jgi:hypothetical protein
MQISGITRREVDRLEIIGLYHDAQAVKASKERRELGRTRSALMLQALPATRPQGGDSQVGDHLVDGSQGFLGVLRSYHRPSHEPRLAGSVVVRTRDGVYTPTF